MKAAAIVFAFCAGSCSSCFAQTAHFAVEGQMLSFDGTQPQRRAASVTTRNYNRSSRVKAAWGNLADGRAVVTLGEDDVHDEDHHDEIQGNDVALMRDDGTAEVLETPSALRAFPAPVGAGVAIITPKRDLFFWSGGTSTKFEIHGRVSHMCWSPDAKRAVLAVYPDDWTPDGIDTAANFDEFLRLQNADLYLVDVASRKVLSQLSSDTGTEYNPFFSPDSADVYYIWLHARERDGGLMRLRLDKDAGTTASQPAQKITKAGDEQGEVPVGRVGTYLWKTNAGSSAPTLLFEAGTPVGPQPAGELWAIRSDGLEPRRLVSGRYPQRIAGGRIAYLTPERKPVLLDETTTASTGDAK